MVEKITDQNLERYDSRLKEWCDRKFFEKGNYGKYQTTEESSAVTFYPVGGSPIEGKVNFLFKETMPAEGTKAPDNPSTITGVSSVKVKRCGKNLIKPRNNLSTQTINDVTFTVNGDGSYTVNGTASSTAYFYIAFKANGIQLKDGCTYTLSGCPSGGGSSSFRLFIGDNINDSGSGSTFSQSGNATYNCFITVSSGYTASNLVFRPQLELGSTVTAFEPYAGNDYTIQLGDTYYGGEIDLATGVMTVTQIAYELDSSFSWNTTSATYIYRTVKSPAAPIVTQNINLFKSSHFSLTGVNTVDMPVNTFFARADGNIIVSTDGLSIQAFKDWLDVQKLAGTPVIITYPLYTPKIVTLTPTEIFSLVQTDKYTPKLNTVYTDADSIQISYLKSPIRDEYEKTQAILSLGGNS